MTPLPSQYDIWIKPLRNYERIGPDAMLVSAAIARFG